MAGARIVLGGELDIASGAELGAAKDSIIEEIRNGRVPDIRPIRGKAQGTITGGVPASQTAVIELVPERPASGKLWNITQIVALGADDHTTMTNASVTWYLSDPANPDITDVVYPAMPIPGVASFAREVIWEHSQQSLFGIVYGATVGSQPILIARFSEFVSAAVQPQGIYGKG